MSFFIRIIPLLVAWGPFVLKAVRAIETMFSDASPAHKKEVAMTLVKAALQRAGLSSPRLLEALSHLIDLLVALLHMRGEFGHTPPPPRKTLNTDAAAVALAQRVEPKLVPSVQHTLAAARLRREGEATRDARFDELKQKLTK